MHQEWFEMPDLRKRRFNRAVWIPLRASQYIELIGERGSLGFREEFFSAVTIAVALDQQATVEKLEWEDVSRPHTHSGWVDGDRYLPADVIDHGGFFAFPLVLEQEGYGDEPNEWHLHQDLAITLKLKREDDTWLASSEDNIAVARLKRNEKGLPILLEFRAEHLRDYLWARRMALYLGVYRDREEVVVDSGHITWPESPVREAIERGRMGRLANGNCGWRASIWRVLSGYVSGQRGCCKSRGRRADRQSGRRKPLFEKLD